MSLYIKTSFVTTAKRKDIWQKSGVAKKKLLCNRGANWIDTGRPESDTVSSGGDIGGQRGLEHPYFCKRQGWAPPKYEVL